MVIERKRSLDLYEYDLHTLRRGVVERSTENNSKNKNKVDDIVSYISDLLVEIEYGEPKTIDIPIFSFRSDSSIEITTARVGRIGVGRTPVSKAGKHLEGSPAKVIAGRRYESDSQSVRIRDVLDILIDTLKSIGFNPDYTDFTDPARVDLDSPFRIHRNLFYASSTGKKSHVAMLRNSDGGIDIFARVPSSTDDSVDYYTLVSVSSKDKSITVSCTCPVGSSGSGVICKHVLHIMAKSLPQILSELTGRDLSEVHDALRSMRRVMDVVRTRYRNVDEAVIYYIVKFFMKSRELSGIYTAKPRIPIKEIFDTLSSGKLDSDELREYIEIGGEADVEVPIPVGAVKPVLYSGDVERARRRVLDMIRTISRFFGTESSDWAKLLTYAVVWGIDYTSPPVSIYAVGEPGTFKTRGASIVAKLIRIPHISISCRGPECINSYSVLISTISRYAGVDQGRLKSYVGGLISDFRELEGGFEASINLAYLVSLIYRRYGSDAKAKLNEIFREVASIPGVVISGVWESPASVRVLDSDMVAGKSSFRYSVILNRRMGIMYRANLFSSYITVVDEVSRKEGTPEDLLTITSVRDVDEATQVMVFTDNIEPSMRARMNPRYDAFFDRVIGVLVHSFRNEMAVYRGLSSTPRDDEVVGFRDLLTARVVLDSIPVPEKVVLVLKAVEYLASYSVATIQVDNERSFVAVMRGNRYRGGAMNLLRDPFGDVEFISGGRFITLTLNLAKFNAFLRGAGHVDLEDIADAIVYTATPRIRLHSVSDPDEYVSTLSTIASFISSFIRSRRWDSDIEKATVIVDRVSRILSGSEKINEEIFNLLDRISRDLITSGNISSLGIFLASIDTAISIAGRVDPQSLYTLPPQIMYTIASLVAVKGDLSSKIAISDLIEKVNNIVRSTLGV